MGFDPVEQIKWGPRTKTAEVAAAAESLGQIHKLETLAGKGNVWKGSELSPKCVETGVRYTGAFCVLPGRPRPPLTAGAFLARPAFFPFGAPVQQYLFHVERDCILLGYKLGWKTKAVAQAAKVHLKLVYCVETGKLHPPRKTTLPAYRSGISRAVGIFSTWRTCPTVPLSCRKRLHRPGI